MSLSKRKDCLVETSTCCRVSKLLAHAITLESDQASETSRATIYCRHMMGQQFIKINLNLSMMYLSAHLDLYITNVYIYRLCSMHQSVGIHMYTDHN